MNRYEDKAFLRKENLNICVLKKGIGLSRKRMTASVCRYLVPAHTLFAR